VFDADAARQWLHPDTTAEAASHLAHNAATPADAFEWFEVSREVNKAGHEGANLVTPIK
jgi:putative SOS response-associated peptidase YedK